MSVTVEYPRNEALLSPLHTNKSLTIFPPYAPCFFVLVITRLCPVFLRVRQLGHFIYRWEGLIATAPAPPRPWSGCLLPSLLRPIGLPWGPLRRDNLSVTLSDVTASNSTFLWAAGAS